MVKLISWTCLVVLIFLPSTTPAVVGSFNTGSECQFYSFVICDDLGSDSLPCDHLTGDQDFATDLTDTYQVLDLTSPSTSQAQNNSCN